MRKQTKIAALVSAAALLAIGASMTSFANWVGPDANGDYEYLDSDGIAIRDEWRTGVSSRDGKTYYYYLDSNGKMATDQLIDTGEYLYYVNENGEKEVNYWLTVPNTEGVWVNDIQPANLYYYFDKNGRAVSGDAQECYKSNANKTDKAKFCFDPEYHMISGWYDGRYCSGEDEGYMIVSDWAALIPPTDTDDDGEPIDPDTTTYWYYFGSDGKMTTNDKPHYIKYNGKSYWFEFSADGILLEEKWGQIVATESNTNTKHNYYIDGGYAAQGWVEADWDNGVSPSITDKTYFYFENGKAFNHDGKDAEASREGVASASNAVNCTTEDVMIWKWNEDDSKWVNVDTTAKERVADQYAARIVDGKTYLFNQRGEYQTGVYWITGSVYRKGSSSPLGSKKGAIYYFDKVSGGPKGSMKTNKQSVTNDYDVTRNYLFKSTGEAVTNQISGGVLYDADGLRVDATDGTWQIVTIGEYDNYASDKNVVLETSPKNESGKYLFQEGDRIVVNANGRVKESGSVVIDGTRYYIKTVNKGTKIDKSISGVKVDSGKVAETYTGETYVIVGQCVVD